MPEPAPFPLAPLRHGAPVGALSPAVKADAFRSASKAKATIRAYGAAWRAFCAWCAAHGVPPLPAAPGTVAGYLADRAAPAAGRPLKAASLWQHAAAIAKAHRLAGTPDPMDDEHVRDTLDGIRRQLGTAPVQKAALGTDQVRRLVAAAGDDAKGARDRALVLLGYAGALRRSELVGLDAEDVRETEAGLEVFVARSKTDQHGAGRTIGICYGSDPRTCPVRAVRAWRQTSGIGGGPLFRPVDRHGSVGQARLSGPGMARILKALAGAAGLDATAISGHSLRAGHATEAARRGARGHEIRKQTGHKSDAMLSRYIRAGTLFEGNSSARLGL